MNLINQLFDREKTEPINNDWKNSYGVKTKKLEYPDCSIHELLYQTVESYPDLDAFTYFGKSASYSEFYQRIEAIAKGLKTIGVQKGDRVTICMPNTPEAIIMIYAVNMIGAIANMVHPLSSVNEIEFYIEVAESKFVFCIDLLFERMLQAVKKQNVEKIIMVGISDSMSLVIKAAYETREFLKKIKKEKKELTYDEKKIIMWDDLILKGHKYEGEYKVSGKSDSEAVVIFSGGTTGRPKGVRLSNGNFNAEALQAIARVESARPGKSALAILPNFHAFGLAVNIHTIFIAGAKCILIPKFEPTELSKLIKKNKPSFLIGVPTMFEALSDSKETSKTYLKSVTDVICGGDILKPELRSKANRYLKDHGSSAQLRVGYGLSETTGACVLTPSYYYKEGAIGQPFPDMNIKIVKPGTQKEVKTNRSGEICVSGPTVMMGYLNEPEENKVTLQTHSDGKIWLHTGDLGFANREGIIFFESRLKRMIITSGYNVYPSYLEAIISSHPAVYTSVVVGIPHPYKKQVAVANIVLKENYEPSDELTEDIRKYCGKSVAKYSMPAHYEYIKTVPKTLIGKVNYKKLEEECTNKYAKDQK